MAELAKGRMCREIPVLEQALTRLVRDHHRRLWALQLAHIDFLDQRIEILNATIAECLPDLGPGAPPPHSEEMAARSDPSVEPAPSTAPMTIARAVSVLDTIPRVD
jgi:hypothetical protein